MDAIFSERFAYPIQSKELNANPELAAVTPIGTGYKILDKNQPAIAMQYRKHPEYWGDEPFIDRWHVPIIPEYANRYAQFVAGNIMDFDPSARDVLLLAKDASQTVIVAQDIPDGRAAKMRFGRNNHKMLPWKDPRVRIAIRRAIDFRGIGTFLSNKEQFEANGIPVDLKPSTHVPIDPKYFLDPEKNELGPLSANYLFDLSEARKLTAAAGFSESVPIEYWVLPQAGVIPDEEQLVIDSLGASGIFSVEVVRSVNATAHRNCTSLGQCDGLSSAGGGTDYDIDV
jgi:ABC-type transport system substrate-binding protein